ncbi:hypothetical protein PGT21_011540 [Puccinia graminis f. sp. tritici]|uniref:Uncharacterized protein n=1 Tax=Puccinia graminis f. sp. tritici TaxID=56615 RepID=A0A5B0NV21_PUCGR|nr:hypothetical protein PGTUg99_015331 [Puccinia graminis f. sp. tritici]KAA1099553.1 hypothetical protein PGT21_011540 [Puccinia graminis f. sp. tritici]
MQSNREIFPEDAHPHVPGDLFVMAPVNESSLDGTARGGSNKTNTTLHIGIFHERHGKGLRNQTCHIRFEKEVVDLNVSWWGEPGLMVHHLGSAATRRKFRWILNYRHQTSQDEFKAPKVESDQLMARSIPKANVYGEEITAKSIIFFLVRDSGMSSIPTAQSDRLNSGDLVPGSLDSPPNSRKLHNWPQAFPRQSA